MVSINTTQHPKFNYVESKIRASAFSALMMPNRFVLFRFVVTFLPNSAISREATIWFISYTSQSHYAAMLFAAFAFFFFFFFFFRQTALPA